jgi:glycosyltransferase involved in cell wall biosynthesis
VRELSVPAPQPRMAVIVPCFDDGATLEETIRSIRAQDEPPELVVVDDGSTEPKTLALFERLKAEGVRVLHQDNQGLAGARMAGVAATEAPLVLALDADDRLAPGALGTLADALERDPELALVWGDYRTFGDAEYVQGTAAALDPWQLTFQNDLPVVVMLRRQALAEAGGWSLRGGYEDWDLWLSLAERGTRGRRLPLVAFEYRLHGTRMLREMATRHGEIFDELRARHAALFDARRALWRRSSAPLALRLGLPLIELLPLGRNRKRQLGGLLNHLAQGRGLGTLGKRLG